MGSNKIEEINKLYRSIKPVIISRLNEFKKVWERGTDKDIFKELVFCILTPQSKAKVCWEAVENLAKKKFVVCEQY